jgi:hypothetical protein
MLLKKKLDKMNNKFINISEFEPILDFIEEARLEPMANQIWLNIRIPRNFVVDVEKCKSIFKSDAAIDYVKFSFGQVEVNLKGTILSPELSSFFISEITKRGGVGRRSW